MTVPPDTRAFGLRGRTRFRPWRVVAGALVLLAVWEAVALWFAARLDHPEFVMPDLVAVFRDGLPGLSAYYRGSLGGGTTGAGADESVGLGLLALVENGWVSLVRVVAGLGLGATAGILLGLVMSALRPLRDAGLGAVNVLRMLPLLALAPLFTLWFGANSAASIAFIAFVVALTMLIAAMTAVGNLDPDLVGYARTLGVRGARVHLRVVLPAIVPELAATLTVCGPLAWSVLLASELYGMQEGLGWMMGEALDFTLVSRITLIAGVFIVLTVATLRAMQLAVRAATRWAE